MQRTVFLVLGLLLFVPTHAFAADAPATEADLPLMKLVGIVNPVVGMSWNTADPNTGRAAGEAKQALASNAVTSANIRCLNAGFVSKVTNMISAAKAAGYAVPPIRDGYRSPAAQDAAKRAGASTLSACEGRHNYGLAVDFNVPETDRGVMTPALAWMRANARNFELATIGDPISGCFKSGKLCDPEHFESTGPQ